MRILCPIVQSFVPPMFDRQTHLLTSRAIARKLIGDHDAWCMAQTLQKLLEETRGGFRVALALVKNVKERCHSDRQPANDNASRRGL